MLSSNCHSASLKVSVTSCSLETHSIKNVGVNTEKMEPQLTAMFLTPTKSLAHFKKKLSCEHNECEWGEFGGARVTIGYFSLH